MLQALRSAGFTMRRWRFSIVNRLAVWGIKLCRVRHGPQAAFLLARCRWQY
jgi:hypothetical protein